MKDVLKNKVAAVTGGTRGIGRAIVEQLLDAGVSVVICGRTAEGVDKAVAELKPRGQIMGIACDVSNVADVSKFFTYVDEHTGGLDILINNAGLGIFRSSADLTIAEWKMVVETNLFGAFYCSHEALSRFKTRGGGYIINISSLAGKNAFATGAAYNASKFGLNGLSEAMMLDHRHEGVRVSYIMPGSVATEFGASGSTDWKIAPSDIADITMMLLRTPERTLISRVEVRPSRPKK